MSVYDADPKYWGAEDTLRYAEVMESREPKPNTKAFLFFIPGIPLVAGIAVIIHHLLAR